MEKTSEKSNVKKIIKTAESIGEEFKRNGFSLYLNSEDFEAEIFNETYLKNKCRIFIRPNCAGVVITLENNVDNSLDCRGEILNLSYQGEEYEDFPEFFSVNSNNALEVSVRCNKKPDITGLAERFIKAYNFAVSR